MEGTSEARARAHVPVVGSAYYNEIDPKKAAWLRELIARNLIAPGEVDERSIREVQAYLEVSA